jgi:hypothetical protein
LKAKPIIFLSLLFMLALAFSASAAWFNTSWNSRLNLTLNNSFNDTLVNYPVNLSVNLTGSNCSDVRIIFNETTPLNWINSTSCGANTMVWFRANLTAYSTNNLYKIYWDNPVSPADFRTNQTDIRGFIKDANSVFIFSFDENMTTLNAYSRGSQSMTLTGTSTPVKNNTNCMFDNCFTFTAAGGYLLGTAWSVLPNSTAEVTLECWAYSTSASEMAYLMGRTNPGDMRGQMQMRTTGATGKIEMSNYDGSTYKGVVSSVTYPINTWFHASVGFNKDDLETIEINGVINQATQALDMTDTGSSEKWAIGATAGGGIRFRGNLDECMLSNKTRTAIELKSNALYYNISYIATKELYLLPCVSNFTCVSFAACSPFNISACLNVSDLVCNTTFAGNVSTYNQNCSYSAAPPGELPPATMDISTLSGGLVFGILVFFWLALLTLTLIFRNFAIASLAWILGIILGFWLFQLGPIFAFGFMLLDTAIFLTIGRFR